jgi:DNA-binding XRE family transcriptional regulator
MNGLEFKKYRKALSISQEIMGKSLFVSKRTIITYEKSAKVPEDKVQLMHSIYSGSEVIKKDVKEEKEFKDLKIDDKLNVIDNKLNVLNDMMQAVLDITGKVARNEKAIIQINQSLLDYSVTLQDVLIEIDDTETKKLS